MNCLHVVNCLIAISTLGKAIQGISGGVYMQTSVQAQAMICGAMSSELGCVIGDKIAKLTSQFWYFWLCLQCSKGRGHFRTCFMLCSLSCLGHEKSFKMVQLRPIKACE